MLLNWFSISAPSQNNSSGLLCFISPLKILKRLFSFLHITCLIEPCLDQGFFVKTTVFEEIYFRKLWRFSSRNLFSTLGMISILVNRSIESCVSMSKVRILSTSSLKKIRFDKDNHLKNENTSMMPPLIAKSPGSTTKSTRLNLYSWSKSCTKSRDRVSATASLRVFLFSSLFVMTCSKRASA